MGPESATTSIDGEFDHEQLELLRDPATGLTGAVAIHSTTLGPAMGGLRLSAYPGIAAAAVDALRLARAMTLKNAAAGLDLGGGKAVLLDDGGWRDPADRAARMRAFGAFLERLGGRYVTAEDVGTTPADMEQIAAVTGHVAGRPADAGGRGDPSPATARTVFGAIADAAALRLGASTLEGVRVGVLGVGHVGARLAALLRDAGAVVLVADIDDARAREVAEATGSAVAPLDGFLGADVDVLAPCALGGAIHPHDAGSLRCRVVAGAANNPLSGPECATALAAAGILYVPDFVANCGGIIHVGAEVLGFDDAEVERRLAEAVERTADVLREASDTGRAPLDVALDRAARRLDAARPVAA